MTAAWSWVDREWWAYAACANEDQDLFFPAEQTKERSWRDPRAVCNDCPVLTECRADAMAAESGLGSGARHGMFAGMTPDERAAADQLARRRGYGSRPGVRRRAGGVPA